MISFCPRSKPAGNSLLTRSPRWTDWSKWQSGYPGQRAYPRGKYIALPYSLKKVTSPKSFIVEVPLSADLESNVDGVDEPVPYTLVAKAELQLPRQKTCNWWGGDGKPFWFVPPF
ncbi:hypothetical protein BJX63DRAFT_55779 [Aspergillus granulosus]|uniref:Uncharacterized protein n=1 Tax=Aspergillus granulosus TaxID=176169 RepID=A0ABR4GXJ6_9EURO